ncbi:MAG: calcineurin phosphoesterase [Johnsonella sp.]|nr:calcineurin phosphoesterase [Johnsonella sp.]
MKQAGRFCPSGYGLEGEDFKNKKEELSCDTLYAVGGLYGNTYALEKVLAMAEEEEGGAEIIFNGDLHWFEREMQDFIKIENAAKKHGAILGNVEAELIREEDIGAGCGCAYPPYVDEKVVERSNLIHKGLKEMLQKNSYPGEGMRKRKKSCCCLAAGKRVALLHGDEKSLAGWGCARENLRERQRQEELGKWMEENRIDIIACTHTCAPAALRLEKKAVINNGAAGMPNFSGTHFGLLTRIGKTKHPLALYRCELEGTYIEALPIHYPHREFLRHFDSNWEKTSPAALSYRERIMGICCMEIKDALLQGFTLCEAKKEREDSEREGEENEQLFQ